MGLTSTAPTSTHIRRIILDKLLKIQILGHFSRSYDLRFLSLRETQEAQSFLGLSQTQEPPKIIGSRKNGSEIKMFFAGLN